MDASEAGDYSGCGSASPFFVHAMGGVDAELEEASLIGE